MFCWYGKSHDSLDSTRCLFGGPYLSSHMDASPPGQLVKHDKCCQEDQHMPTCCQLDAITIATTILCFIWLRCIKAFDKRICGAGSALCVPSHSLKCSPMVQEHINLVYIDSYGENVLVYKHFGLEVAFRN